MRLLELILRQSNATELPRQPALQTSAVMEETSGNNMTQLAYGPLLGDTLLTECMPQLGNFLGGSDDCLSFDSITFENGHLAHPEGPLHGNASKEFNTETSSALATLLQSSHILTSGIRSSTSALSLVTATPGVQVASPGEVTTLSNRGDDAICVQCDRSSSTVASSREPSSGNDNGSRVTFTLDSVETMSVNIVNEPLSGSPTEGASSVNSHVQSIDDDLNVFHLADKEEIDITNFPLFNLDEALLENGIDAQDMSSLLEQFEASAEGNTSTELLDAAGLSPLPGSSSDNKMAALSMPRSASTTVLGEASGVVSRTHRKSMTDKILRSASEDCLRSIAPRAKTCNTNTLGKPSHVAKLCTSSAKHAKLAQKTADSHAKLPVHKSSSEVLLGQHRGTAAFKTGKRKHKSKQRLPNQTVSAPTSPAPSPRSSPSRDIIRKIKASSQKRKGAIMLTDPLPTRGCRSSRKPLKMPDMNPPSTRDYIITSSVETVPGSDSDGSLVSDTSSGLPTGGNLSDGQQRLSSTSKKISISLYRSRLQQRLQKQQEEGTAVEDGSSGRSSPCEVNMNYYDQILDHDYCQNVPLCNQEVPEVQNVPLCTDLASVLIVPRLSKFDIDAAMAACKKEKDNEMENSTPNNSAARLPPNGVVGVEPLTTSTSIASDVNGTILNNQPSKEGHPSKKMYPDATKVEIKAVATENTSTRSRRETITDVVDMDIDSDNGGSHGDDAVKRGAVSKPSVVVDTEMADGNKNDSDSVAKPSHKSRPEMLVSIAEKEVEYSSPEGSTGEVLAPQKHVGDTVGLPETCSNASTEVGKEVNRFSRFDSEKQETSTPAKGQILNDRGNTGFKPHSGRSRNQNYRRNNRSPYHKDDEYYDKVPNYFTALSVQSQITQPIKRVHSGLQLVDESLPGHDRDPSPNRNDPVYDKLPAYYSCFTNSVRYDNNNHDDPLAANGGDSASNSGYSSRSSSVSTDTRGSSRGRSLSISSSWSCSSRSCSRERQPYRSSRSSWQRQRSRVHRRRSYSSSSRSLSRSRSSRSRSPLSRSSRSYSRRRSYSRHSRSRSRRSWSRRSRSRHRHTRGHSSRQRKRSRSSSDELISSQRADAQMRQIEERRIVYVGRIPTDYTKSDLRRRFGRFGVIEDVSVHFREHGDNYGFVTFEYTCDAFAAKENGNKVPGCETFDLCFGGRRHFCRSNYADLDGNMEDEEEMCGVMPKQVTADLDFDALLRQATKKLKNKQRKL